MQKSSVKTDASRKCWERLWLQSQPFPAHCFILQGCGKKVAIMMSKIDEIHAQMKSGGVVKN